MPTPALEVHGLVKRYRLGLWRRPRTALDGLTFELPAGQVLGLIGPNGGGKTTTFGCVLGLLRPSAGRIRVFGLPPERPAARRVLGFVPESSPFPARLRAAAALRMYGVLAGLTRRESARRVAPLLERVGLAHAATQRLGTFSKGMLRRFALAQALIGEPRLLLLDEPASGLDPLGARDLRRVVEQERERGTAVLIASHELAALETLCDRFVLLDRGRMILHGPRQTLLAGGRRLEQVFFEAVARARGEGGAPS